MSPLVPEQCRPAATIRSRPPFRDDFAPAIRDELTRLRDASAGSLFLSHEIARRVGVAPSTVRLTQRVAAAGLGWPLPAEITDAALEAGLFTTVGTKLGHRPPGRAGLGEGSVREVLQKPLRRMVMVCG
jgi:hypothetical protein